jgi:16S rRNA (guanine527-N7)-methyltransferase
VNTIRVAPSAPPTIGREAARAPSRQPSAWSGLTEEAARLGVTLDAETAARFARYRDLLLAWSARMNLTAVRHPVEIERRLLLDALAMIPALDEMARSIDPGWMDRCVVNRGTGVGSAGDASVAPTSDYRLPQFDDANTIVGATPASPAVPNKDVPPRNDPPPLTLIDVGAGAGFPGLVLKIARPTLDVTLLDATAKKVAFLDAVICDLDLAGVRAVHGRAEEFGQHAAYRGQFDLATARAVAALPVLLEYVVPLLRVGGAALLPKGLHIAPEVRDGRRAARLLGAEIVADDPLPVPGTRLVVVRKTAPTSARYPRRTGLPRQAPLAGEV